MMLRAVCAKGPFEESEVTARLRWVMWLSLRDLSEVAFGIAFLVLLLKRPDSDAFTMKLNLRRSLATSLERQSWWRSCHGRFRWSPRLMVILGLYTVRGRTRLGSDVDWGKLGSQLPPPSFTPTKGVIWSLAGSFDGSNIVLDILVQLQNIVEWLFYYDSFV